MSEPPPVSNPELISRVTVAVGVGLNTDQPSLAGDTAPLIEMLQQRLSSKEDSDFSFVERIALLYAGFDWFSARLELQSAAIGEELGEVGMPLLNLLFQDIALASFRRSFVHYLADALAGNERLPLLENPGRAGLSLYVLADEQELMSYFGGHFVAREAAPARLRASGLQVASEEIFREQLFRLPSVPGVLESLGSPDIRAGFIERVNGFGLGSRFCAHLATLRPARAEDAEGTIWLLDLLLQVTRWVPEPGELAAVIEHYRLVADKSAEAPTHGVLNGMAKGAIETNKARSAAIWSLESYREHPAMPALSRALHEACSATDHEVATLALGADPWIEEHLDDEELAQTMFALKRVRWLLAGGLKMQIRIRELAEHCAAQARDPVQFRNGEYEELFLASGEREKGDSSSVHFRAEGELRAFNIGLLGIREEDLAGRIPYTAEDDLERVGPLLRLSVSHLMSRAFAMAFDRGAGPLGMLALADCALEIGDLRHATSLVSKAEQAYPRSISVYLARIKLAGHASRRSEAERYAGLLATELRESWDALSAMEISRTLLLLPAWVFDFLPDLLPLALEDPRLAEHHDALRERLPR